MSRQVLDLSNLEWRFGPAPRQPTGTTPADDRDAVREWLPAKVPGDVRADLVAAGRIPPVDTPEGIAAGGWADACDWWYRAEVPGGWAAGERVVLEADGIDYYSAVWLDDRLLATHAGMFARQTVILPQSLRRPGPHALAIRIWGGGALPVLPNPLYRRAVRWLLTRLGASTEYFPDRMATPKAQFSFGWDFSPRLLTAGIWDEGRLVVGRGAYIEDLWVQAEPLADAGDDPCPVRWHLLLRLSRWTEGPCEAQVTIRREGCDEEGEGTFRFCLDEPTPRELPLAVEMPAVRRWWPWDQGEPCLYRVTVRLVDRSGPMDEISRVTGVRTVARRALPGGDPWNFIVNGRPVFLRGANWVPADVLPGRVSPADYARLLGQARDAGINFLRVWGGGIREKRGFWEACNRLGLMAWQEFPLACAFLDHYPRDQRYLDVLASEARGIVRLLRNHPSLIAWCGGNEINPARQAVPLRTIGAVLREEDPARLWIPASPSDGAVHQWQVWHGYAPWTDLACCRAPFLTEFGLQALPDAATISEMFGGAPPESLSDPRWAARKAQVDKLRHYAGLEADAGLVTAIAATQRVQAAAIQAGVEACRLRRLSSAGSAEAAGTAGERDGGAPACGGVAFWQFNEPWPAVSWAVIDRAGRPKAAYEALRHCCQPVLIAARFPRRPYRAGDLFRAQIWLANDGPLAWRGCHAEADLDGYSVWAAAGLDLPPASAACVGDLTWTLVAPPQRLYLRLTCGESVLAENFYDLAVPVARAGPRSSRLNQWLAARLLGSG